MKKDPIQHLTAAVPENSLLRKNPETCDIKLGPDEEDVLLLMALGMSSVDAMYDLEIDRKTLKGNLEKIARKLGTHSALQSVIVGGHIGLVTLPSTDSEDLLEAKDPELSYSQTVVAQGIAFGLRPKQVAESLELSHKTVINHLHCAFRKTQLKGQRELVIWGLQQQKVFQFAEFQE